MSASATTTAATMTAAAHMGLAHAASTTVTLGSSPSTVAATKLAAPRALVAELIPSAAIATELSVVAVVAAIGPAADPSRSSPADHCSDMLNFSQG